MARTVLARYLTTLVDTMSTDYDVKSADLYQKAGISPVTSERILETEAEALWVAAEALAPDELLGLKVGARVRYSTYSTLGHLLVTTKTVGESLKAACDLAFYVGAAGQLSMAEGDDECSVIYEPLRADWRAAEVRSEAVLLPFARFARWASPGVEPRRVLLTRKKPENPAAFEAAFGAPVQFNAPHHAIVWATEAMDSPMTDANPALNDMLRQHVQAEMPETASLSAQVRGLLQARLTDGAPMPAVVATARALGISERSLQRALESEGTNFRDVLGAVRKEAAEQMLKSGKTPIADIASQLGYSEPAAFVRAFGRWNGCSPAQWRKRGQS